MKSVVINERDNVGVALLGDEKIPSGHKFALRDIKAGEFVIKYGEIIGRATSDIKAGEWVHTHNLKSHLDESVSYSYEPSIVVSERKEGSFLGYKRKRGRAGIRNEIYVIPTVGCVNGVCARLVNEARGHISGSIDGIYALTHQFGCSQLGDDGENIKKLLCSVARNPNASFVLFVGLGCENNGIEGIKQELADCDNIAYLNCQDVSDEQERGMNILLDFIGRAKDLSREEIPLSELCVGLKCGGSDGYSGITANPLVGRITDRVIAHGASAVLTEVPEMFGAEQRLMNKCKTREIFERYKKMIEDFKASYTDAGFPVYENPSPGNRAGGITTLEEKSLGCVEKAGSSAIVDVLDYGERVKASGVSVLNGPGNDLIAATALAAAGCQIVLFTTGRGTPFSTFVPTMKIGTTDTISEKKAGWIDFSAYSMDEEGLFSLIMDTVSGRYRVKSEDIREIAFYKTGVTL